MNATPDPRQKGRPRKYTSEDRAQVLAWRQQGLSERQIEEIHGVPKGSVHYLSSTAPASAQTN